MKIKKTKKYTKGFNDKYIDEKQNTPYFILFCFTSSFLFFGGGGGCGYAVSRIVVANGSGKTTMCHFKETEKRIVNNLFKSSARGSIVCIVQNV